jgi:hypothetical protein
MDAKRKETKMTDKKAMHTPGPWEAVEAPYNPKGWLWIKNGPGALLADVHQNANIPLEVRNANARLMAASPDLLAALKAILNSGELDGRAPDKLIEIAKDAISKAIGND